MLSLQGSMRAASFSIHTVVNLRKRYLERLLTHTVLSVGFLCFNRRRALIRASHDVKSFLKEN